MARKAVVKVPEPEAAMNLVGLARLLGVAPSTVSSKFLRDGMPVHTGGGRGRQASYMPSACVRWRIAQIESRYLEAHADGLSPLIERARKDRAQARLAEQLLQVRTGKLVQVEAAEQLLTRIVHDCSVAFRGLHARVAARHGGLSRQVILDIETEVHQVLDDLANAAEQVDLAGAHSPYVSAHDRDPEQRNGHDARHHRE